MDIETYWKDFLKNNNLNQDLKYFESFSFGINDSQAEELLKLVLDGKKKATTSAYLEEEKYPKINDYSIVLDSKGQASCIIQTKKIRIMTFKEMTFEIAKLEGEDECLDTWIKNHIALFKEEGEEKGYSFTYDMPIFFEEFELVYK